MFVSDFSGRILNYLSIFVMVEDLRYDGGSSRYIAPSLFVLWRPYLTKRQTTRVDIGSSSTALAFQHQFLGVRDKNDGAGRRRINEYNALLAHQ